MYSSTIGIKQYLIHNTSEDSLLLVLQDVLLYHRYNKAILYLIHNTSEDSVLEVSKMYSSTTGENNYCI
jgi:hypothetical protein